MTRWPGLVVVKRDRGTMCRWLAKRQGEESGTLRRMRGCRMVYSFLVILGLGMEVVRGERVKAFAPTDGGRDDLLVPGRVLDEMPEGFRDVELQRSWPIVSDLVGSCKELGALLDWVWSDHGGDGRIAVRSHTAEWRNRSPNQLLASRQSACRELNIFYVAAVRAVGIPARHCGVGRWLHRDGYHFFAEYWDAEQEKWVTVDTSDDKFQNAETPAERVANGRWNSLVYYAYPGNPDEPDLYGKGRWDKMVNITGDLAEEFPLEIVWPDLERGGTLSAQIWNGGSWRTILIQEVKAGEAPVVVNFGKTHVTTRPVMFSADIEGERYLAMVKAAELDHQVVLEKVEGGRSLGWSPGVVPKEVGE